MLELETIGFQSTSVPLQNHSTIGRSTNVGHRYQSNFGSQLQSYFDSPQQMSHSDMLLHRSSATYRMTSTSSNGSAFLPAVPLGNLDNASRVDVDFEENLLSALGMTTSQPLRAPRPGGPTIGQLEPVGDAILPLLACVLVYMSVRVRRAFKKQ